ncbi:hypothetical protein LCGC14_1167150 [marine sediment metagenome]|uniref:Uncharacterized protein n=1 Tax=marine sediment metagenome TaxID=412755 RepID=A0A0F9LVT2_9ZZZZ
MIPKVYIGSAIWRGVEPLHMKALAHLLRDPHYGYFPETGDALIERARGISASHFLRHTDAEVHLSLDSDIIEFLKPAIDLMCEQAVTHDIVGGLYITRATARTFPTSMFLDNQTIEFASDPTPQPVRWIATGCVAVHRRGFEKMAETMPLLHEQDGERAFYNFYHTMEYDTAQDGNTAGRILLSEDYAFSQRAKELGFTSHINPVVRVGHVGPYAHRLEDMAQEILTPQPLRISHVDRYWQIECAGTKETPESMGRLPEGKGEEIRKKFDETRQQRRARRGSRPAGYPSRPAFRR